MAFTRVRGPGITTDDNYRVGILTATKFVGPMQASGDSDFTNISATGIGTIDGVKIGDPSGIVTASSSSGIVTYYGDASKLTGLTAGQIPNLAASKITSGTIDTARLGSGTANNTSFLRGDQTWASNTSTTINNNTNNYVVTATGTANTLNGEANLTYDGTTLKVNHSTNPILNLTSTNGGPYNTYLRMVGNDTELRGSSGNIEFFTGAADGGSSTERLRIHSGGQVTVGTPTSNTSDRFTIVDPGNAFMSLRSDAEADGNSQIIDFAVGTANRSSSNLVSTITAAIPTGAAASGTLKGYLAFSTNSGDSLSERVRIDESGRVLIGSTDGATYSDSSMDDLIIGSTANGKNDGLTILSGTAQNGSIAFADSGGTSRGLVGYVHNGDYLRFNTAGSERLRIDSSGRVLIKATTTRAISGDNALLQIENPSSGLLSLLRTSNDNGAAWLAIAKSRSSAGAACQAGDQIGGIAFTPHDGTDLNHHAAEIRAYVDTGIGSNDTPGYLSFHTNSGASTTTERLRIDSSGRVTIKNGGSNLASEFNSGANQFVITHNASCGLTIDATSSTSSSIHFADGATGGESYRGIIEYQHSVDDMKFAVEATHVARLRKGSYSDVGGGMIIGNGSDNSGDAHSDSRTLILGSTGRGETGMTFLNSSSGSGKLRFSDGTSPFNQGTIAYYHGTRTIGSIPTYPESFSISPAQRDNMLVLNGNEAMRVNNEDNTQKMVDGFWEKSINTSYQTVFTIQAGSSAGSSHYGYFYEIIVYGADWGSHSANRVYFKGFVNGYSGYGGHTPIEHSGPYGSNSYGGGSYGSSECQIQVVFGSSQTSEIQMRLTTGSVTAQGYARIIGYVRNYSGFNIR